MPNHPTGSRELIRAINRSNVLNSIKTRGPISRIEIARASGLSAATVSGITSELIEGGLILEKEAGDSLGGRRPIPLVLNPRGGYVIGFKLAEDHITGALTDLNAKVIANRTFQLSGRSIDSVILALGEGVKALLEDGAIHKDQLFGVGVGLAGIIDAQNGILRHSPYFGWRNVPLQELLQTQLGVSATVDNDVNTLTLTEQWFGMGQGIDNFLTVTIGRGVGLGMVINGQLYRGTHGGSGEFGHTVIDPNGPLCDCGKSGCLEALVADPGLIRDAKEKLGSKSLTMDELLGRAEKGDKKARAIFSTAGETLARGVANLINVLNPKLIIISGEGVRAGNLLFDPMRIAIDKYVMPGLAEDTEIRIDTWDDTAWARGAAGLVLGELFKSPIYGVPVASVT
jgi:predicted NBD/HSP70 family sugar kinase